MPSGVVIWMRWIGGRGVQRRVEGSHKGEEVWEGEGDKAVEGGTGVIM